MQGSTSLKLRLKGGSGAKSSFSEVAEPQKMKIKHRQSLKPDNGEFVVGAVARKKRSSSVNVGLKRDNKPDTGGFFGSIMPTIGSMFPTKVIEESESSPDMDNLSIEEDEDLFLLARLEKQKSEKHVTNVTTADWLGSQFTASFRAAKSLISEEDEMDVDGVDWEFWGIIS
jgi:hypothetical protein